MIKEWRSSNINWFRFKLSCSESMARKRPDIFERLVLISWVDLVSGGKRFVTVRCWITIPVCLRQLGRNSTFMFLRSYRLDTQGPCPRGHCIADRTRYHQPFSAQASDSCRSRWYIKVNNLFVHGWCLMIERTMFWWTSNEWWEMSITFLRTWQISGTVVRTQFFISIQPSASSIKYLMKPRFGNHPVFSVYPTSSPSV